MLKLLINNELKISLHNNKFILIFIIINLLFLLNGIIFNKNIEKSLKDYNLSLLNNKIKIEKAKENLSQLIDVEQNIYLAPNQFGFIKHEDSSRFLDYMETTPMYFNYEKSKIGIPELVKDFSFDVIFIVMVILSFISIILSYNAFSSTATGNTSKIIYSYYFNRLFFLLSKFLPVLFILGISLFCGFMLNIIILGSQFHLSADLILRTLIIFLFCLSYISFFSLLTMFVSLLFHKQSHVLIVMLLIWSFFVFLIPLSGKLISASLIKLPNNNQARLALEKEIDELWVQSQKDENKATMWRENCFEENIPLRNMLFKDMAQIKSKTHEKIFRDMFRQVLISYPILKISPSFLFSDIVLQISNNGIYRHINFLNQVKKYRKEYFTFIVNEDLKDKDSAHALFVDNMCISQKPFIPEKVPVFKEKLPLLFQVLNKNLSSIFLFHFYILLLFLFCLIMIRKYDPR
ncbi:MAG: ABC transporter permease subunit [Pseudomonadota bacterium]